MAKRQSAVRVAQAIQRLRGAASHLICVRKPGYLIRRLRTAARDEGELPLFDLDGD